MESLRKTNNQLKILHEQHRALSSKHFWSKVRLLDKLCKNTTATEDLESVDEDCNLPLPELYSAIGKYSREKLNLSQLESARNNATATAATDKPSHTPTDRPKYSRKTPENRVRRVKKPKKNPDGTITVPARYNPVTIVELGEVMWENAAFHSDRYIFPVGYRIVRKYMSMIDSDNDQSPYECSIAIGSDGSPLYEVKSVETGEVFSSKTTSGAWTPVITRAYQIRNKQVPSAIGGPDLFGFTSAEMAKLIQALPNADKCSRYKWQTFIES